MFTTSRLRILYADHDCDSCEMFTKVFESSEIDVACARTITEALKSADWIEFDAYLLGTSFDDGNAIDLCRRLRARNPRTPIVFYSRDVRESYRHDAFSAGADAYVAKPDSDQAVSTITNLLVVRRGNAMLPFMPMEDREFYSSHFRYGSYRENYAKRVEGRYLDLR